MLKPTIKHGYGEYLQSDAKLEPLDMSSMNIPLAPASKAREVGLNDDAVNHPSHYTQGGIECIEAIKASMTHKAFVGYLKGNVLKYLWRYENKNYPLEDLRKAQWYLNRLIEEVGKSNMTAL